MKIWELHLIFFTFFYTTPAISPEIYPHQLRFVWVRYKMTWKLQVCTAFRAGFPWNSQGRTGLEPHFRPEWCRNQADGNTNFHLYHYAGNNPVKYVDPDGRCFDTIWDAFNASLDVASFKSNIISGNYVGAAWDFASLLYDGFATATPVLPGGTGSAKLISKLSADKIKKS